MTDGIMYRRLAAASTFVPLAFALLGLAAWITGLLRLASLRTEYIPMAPSTAVAFVFVSAALLAVAFGHGPTMRNAVRAAACLVSVLAFIELVEFFTGIEMVNWEAVFIARPGTFGAVSLGRMSPLTAMALVMVGLALACLTSARSPAARDLGGVLGSLDFLMGSTVVLGYAYGAPLLYGGHVIPMAITTGVALMGTGVALVALAGPTHLPLRPFLQRTKQAEETLARLNRQHQLILASAGEGILGLDLKGNHTFVNPAAARMLGYEAEELLGRPSHSVWHHTKADGTPYPKEECQIYAAYRDGTVHRVSTEVFWRKDGTSVPVEYASTPIYEQGLLVGAVVTFTDITERKRAEEERARLEAQFQQAQKMEVIGRLAGGIAHDFNNLLTAILGYSELLLEAVHDHPALAADVKEIRSAGERASRLTRQLLGFSRKQVLSPRVLDLNQVVRDLRPMATRVMGDDVQLDIVAGTPLNHVTLDPGQVEQVLMNLLVNARDAMPKGGRVTIATANVEVGEAFARTHRGVMPGPHVSISVADTGSGMPSDVLARASEPFFTTKPQGKGTGLGLSTVFNIVKESGGCLVIESEVGTGTTVTSYFPKVDAPREAETASVQPTHAPSGTETILLAEDDVAIRELAHRVLKACGYTVLVARDGAHALAVEANHPEDIHLLLTDVMMPELSGPDLAQRLVRRRPALKVLYMSGFGYQVAVASRLVSRHTAFLQKPFTPELLASRVRMLLDSADSAALASAARHVPHGQ